MEIKEIQYEDKPFDMETVAGLDPDTVNAAFELGNKTLEYQYETIAQVRANCRMMLSWLVGAMLALPGVFTFEAVSETPRLAILITSGYEFLIASATAFIIIRGAMFKRTVFYPGDSPSHFLHENFLNALKDFPESRCMYLKGWHLYYIQMNIMDNKKEQAHQVKVYRRALALILFGLLSGMVLLTALLLFL